MTAVKHNKRILIAEEHQIMAEGLRSMIESRTEYQVAGIASDGLSALKMVRENEPEVVITGIDLPNINGSSLTRKIANLPNRPEVIVLSHYNQQRFLEEMIQAGAKGYILKDCCFDELIQCIDAVTKGQVYLCREICDSVVNQYYHRVVNNTFEKEDILTSRETEVLQRIAEGLSTQEIARKLHISPKTVETHRRKIMEKLEIKTVAGLTKYALKEGIVSL